MFTQFDKKVDKILSKLTLRQKIGQLNQVRVPRENEVEAVKEMIRNGDVGSIILAGSAHAGNDEYMRTRIELNNELQRIAVEESAAGIPIIFGKDVIHGHHTVCPIPLASAAAFNEELVEKCYTNIAEEASSDSVHWTFSPMLDLCRDPRWGRMVEGPGEDPVVGARVARACVKGFQGKDVSARDRLVACAKHYIGYGASEGGRDYHHTEISDYSLYNYYLPAFRAAVDAGIGTVMSSFNEVNGVPTGLTGKYLTDILRGDLCFEGYVISDWDQVKQLMVHGVAENEAECAKLGVTAGVDMDMNDKCYINHLEQLVAEGKVSEETINTAVKRVLRIKLAKGIFEHPYCEIKTIDRTEHITDSRALATESMVLLKNNGVLPLQKNQKVFLSGPFMRERRALLGTWTLDGIVEETPNLHEAIWRRAEKGCLMHDADSVDVFNNLTRASADAEVIILALGESHRKTGEQNSMRDISLDSAQIELVKHAKLLGKKVVGVFFAGRPLALEGVAEYLDAILYAWHCGSQTANAAADILYGTAVPSGKTPVTFPRTTGQIPIYYNCPPAARHINGYYSDREARMAYHDGLSSPLYPFGYGLSYTTFDYGTPACDNNEIALDELKQGATFKISVEVTNSGNYDGKEVVQLYIRDKVASRVRPMRELKDYKKILIRQGETAKVEFELGYKELGFYFETGEYVVEPGEFTVFVGTDCKNTKNFDVVVK